MKEQEFPRKPRIQFGKTRVPVGDGMIELVHVKDIEALMGRMSREEIADKKLPYYGELWPASIALARWVWKHMDFYGKEVLDLGCGVGLVGISAAKRGGRVVFADYYSQALELAKINVEKNGCPGSEFEHMDWRDKKYQRQFDCILASDVLYEARNHEPILSLLQRCLPSGAFAVISDPQRQPSAEFFEKASQSFELQRDRTFVQLREVKLPVDIVQLRKR